MDLPLPSPSVQKQGVAQFATHTGVLYGCQDAGFLRGKGQVGCFIRLNGKPGILVQHHIKGIGASRDARQVLTGIAYPFKEGLRFVQRIVQALPTANNIQQ